MGSRVGRFANSFHEWRSREWKSSAYRFTSDPENIIHGNKCIILFVTRYIMDWTHNSAENIYRSPMSPLSPRTFFFWLNIVTSPQVICDATRMRGTGIVTSYSSIVLARAIDAKRSSLVNNNREYWFLTTRDSRLGVQEISIWYIWIYIYTYMLKWMC